MTELKQLVEKVCHDLFNVNTTVELTRPAEQFGDYATNAALQLAKQISNPPQGGPRAIAEMITNKLQHEFIQEANVAGPGFINFRLSDKGLIELASRQPAQPLADKVIVTEYSDPNPFKVLHAGHLYTSVVGDAISSLLEVAGGKVHRVNYGGDVGLHVGKTMWAIVQELGGERPEKLSTIPKESRSEWMATAYIKGEAAYTENEEAKAEITAINKRVYQLHADNDRQSPFAQIYWTCRQWSYEYFDEFYARIGTKFEKYYPESEVAPLGLAAVKEYIAKGVYEESDGAIVFRGEPYGFHTRVFINSQGLPTYETKEVGVMLAKWRDYHFDKSLIITGNDIAEYMKVVQKSIEQYKPELVKATTHLTHGNVKLAGGVKMSSRKGNILRAVDVLETAAEANKRQNNQDNPEAVLGAVKYAFLKQRIGGDIIYDPEESVSILGNSGPYLQYAHARARSILAKAKVEDKPAESFEPAERSLLRKLGEYAEVVDKAVEELMPHHVTGYLYELAQNFNRFYEKNRVIGDPREVIRLQLVQAYADTLKNGLGLLNIPAPNKM